MNKPGSMFRWLAVFAAGFVLGIVYSAWRIEKAPSSSPTALSKAEEQPADQEKIAKRIEAVAKMLEKDPNNAQALIQLGNDQFDTGNHEKAVEAYEKALRLDPRNANVITDLGISYRKLGKPELAADSFRKAIQADPDHAKALFHLGLVLRKDLNNPKGALDAWETFLKKAPDHPYVAMVKPGVEQLKQEIAEKKK
ncbi:MAG: tetratricopeptide repeat protein [Thermodesulfobacteriota bacterium]